MNELIKKVSLEAGINNEQAEKAINSVVSSLKEKLPAVMHSQIDTLVNGGTMTDAFKKQMHEFTDRAEEVVVELREHAEEIAAKLRNKFNEVFNKDEEKFNKN